MWYIGTDNKDYIAHFGILGMKWGVRRYQNPDGSLTDAGKKRYSRVVGSKGDISVVERKTKGFYDIINKDSKKVGRAIIDDEGDNDHLDWIGINEKYRRNGYGQTALNIIMKDSKKRGKKTMTLEAAGLDPAAAHVYSKMGFKEIENVDSDLWNDLLVMKKKL